MPRYHKAFQSVIDAHKRVDSPVDLGTLGRMVRMGSFELANREFMAYDIPLKLMNVNMDAIPLNSCY